MKEIKTEDAVGQILCHDITQIIRNCKKGPVFRKGHVITAEDIPVLLSVGKNYVYVWENNDKVMHENDAAMVLYDLCKNVHMHPSQVKEGKVEVLADCDGLLKIDRERLLAVNSFGQMMIATRHDFTSIKKNDVLAGARIIPLVIEKEKMAAIKKKVAGGSILQIMPFQKKKVGIVITGNEVYSHLIEDAFTPVIEEKLEAYDTEIVSREICPDDADRESACIQNALNAGSDIVICTGGMSVDPDDRTPAAIRATADRVVTYGAPVLPGAMFMLAYKGEQNKTAILGLPGCVMYFERTIFDLMLPRIMADVIIEKKDIDALGLGGLCLKCPVCTFDSCGFGRI